ncbi:siroheme synthase CysG [Thiohalorhabdus methylotrophus]|uniref:Siroheme synthase n=1 Tax=Thiohalorhabdus methylotrophus TaxID=3242694 RepID=A0ABV4TTM5_9GAMM
MAYLPLFHDLHRRPCLVVGGGTVAARKVALLRRAGARITVVAPEIDAELAELAADGTIAHRARPFRETDACGKVLVVAATGDPAVNRTVGATGRTLGIPVNAVDDPEAGTAIMPALVDRSPLVVAISSGGAAPVLARQIRARLEAWLPDTLGRLAALAAGYRDRVKAVLPDLDQRRRFWERVLDGPIGRAVLAGRESAARAALEADLSEGGSEGDEPGEVYLVGAGPGDPDLLTLKAARLMQECDVVLHDRLVPEAVLERVRRDAERIPVGKAPGCHTMSQAEISERLVVEARRGRRVLRLKGGDPFVFGRGGEELEALADAGVAYQVVPGVTAATGCAAYAGIPLTHRAHADTCLLATGYSCREDAEPDWSALAGDGRTAVFYMGLRRLENIRERLLAHGRAPGTPAAVIVAGTTPGQTVRVGTLGDLPELSEGLRSASPALIIVGEVAALRKRLAWFDTRPGFAAEAGTGSAAGPPRKAVAITG